jgi:hypothetical protein
MRRGFYGITDEEAIDTTQTVGQRMVSALTSPFGSAGVNVRLTSLFVNDLKAGSGVRSMVHVQASDLTFTEEADGWHKAVFDVLAVTFGDNGVVVDQSARTQTIRLRGDVYRRVLKDGFTYDLIVPIKKTGAYQFRIALRDATSNRIGSASQFIEVPDVNKNRLILSGIIMKGVPPETYQKRGVDVLNENYAGDESSATDSKASPAVRQFRPGLVMVYGFMVYNAQIDKGTGQPQLHTQVRLFRNGQPVFTGKEMPLNTAGQLDLKRLISTGAVNLGTELEPGEYAFQIVVTDTRAKEKHRVATQWIDFEIVK